MDRTYFAVGLTGGLGSGKSALADRLAELGAGVVDADAAAHRLTAAGGAALPSIQASFGPQAIGPDGALDRARMRATVFADTSARQRLERILHPLIMQACLDEAAGLAESAPYVVFVVPLLVESGGWHARVDRILVTDCPVATQIERVVRRRGLSEQMAGAIIAAQAPRRVRLQAADDVVVNWDAPDALARAAARLHVCYTGLAAGRRSGR
jgi:dephospho-CoA kinase